MRKTETRSEKERRQIKEAFIDGYMSAADRALAGRPERAVRIDAERAWEKECVTS